jgi:hypothetical protein
MEQKEGGRFRLVIGAAHRNEPDRRPIVMQALAAHAKDYAEMKTAEAATSPQ